MHDTQISISGDVPRRRCFDAAARLVGHDLTLLIRAQVLPLNTDRLELPYDKRVWNTDRQDVGLPTGKYVWVLPSGARFDRAASVAIHKSTASRPMIHRQLEGPGFRVYDLTRGLQNRLLVPTEACPGATLPGVETVRMEVRVVTLNP